MNEQKQHSLFAAMRDEPSAQPPADFSARVLEAVRHRQARSAPTLVDQLADLFPRLAAGAVLLIALAVAADFYYEGESDFAAELSQVEHPLWLAGD